MHKVQYVQGRCWDLSSLFRSQKFYQEVFPQEMRWWGNAVTVWMIYLALQDGFWFPMNHWWASGGKGGGGATKGIYYIMNVGGDDNTSVLPRPQGQGQTTLWASFPISHFTHGWSTVTAMPQIQNTRKFKTSEASSRDSQGFYLSLKSQRWNNSSIWIDVKGLMSIWLLSQSWGKTVPEWLLYCYPLCIGKLI